MNTVDIASSFDSTKYYFDRNKQEFVFFDADKNKNLYEISLLTYKTLDTYTPNELSSRFDAEEFEIIEKEVVNAPIEFLNWAINQAVYNGNIDGIHSREGEYAWRFVTYHLSELGVTFD